MEEKQNMPDDEIDEKRRILFASLSFINEKINKSEAVRALDTLKDLKIIWKTKVLYFHN